RAGGRPGRWTPPLTWGPLGPPATIPVARPGPSASSRSSATWTGASRRPSPRERHMTTGSRSYLKTVILAAAGGALIIAATLVGSAFETGPAKLLVELIGWPLGLLSECVAAGGLLVVYRSTHLDLGQTDLFLRLNEARSLEALDAAG